jgi:hypothetical protein
MSEYLDNKDLFLEPKVKQYGNHMVMTNVVKPTKTKYYNIDTRFRDDYDEYSNTSPTFYNITLPQRINDVKSIMVCNCEIPISYYNISASLGNNSLQIIKTSGNIIKTLIIKDGNYDISGLIYEMNNELKTIGFSDLIFNNNNNSSFSCISSYTINLAIKTTMTTSGNSINTDFDKYNFKSKLGWILGFRNISYSISSTKLLSESFIDLNGPRYLYLIIDEFNNGNQNSFVSPLYTSLLNKNILSKISIDNKHYGFGSILTANNFNGYLLTDRRSYNGKVDLQRLKIQLVNEIGIPLNLNGLDFSFSLEIEYE